MNKAKKPFIFSLVITLLAIAGGAMYTSMIESRVERSTVIEDQSEDVVIDSFEDCVAAGNPVQESYPERCTTNGQSFTNEVEISDDGLSDEILSGQGVFSVRLPRDWGEVLRPTDSDWFMIPGMQQPEGDLKIKDTESYGSDSPSVFSILVHDNFAQPQGSAEDFTLVNGKENSITGKKYTKIYQADELVGIGTQRYAGDRDYEYVFELPDGKELRVFYSVYGVDPRNNLVTVEAIIDSILLK